MDVFTIAGKISIDYNDAVKKIDSVTDAANESTEALDKMDDAADGAGKGASDAGDSAERASEGFTIWKGVMANLVSDVISRLIDGCTQLAGKVAEVTQTAVGNYAQYEQLVGGVETLFKDSAGTLIGYAETAYKTAGMSSNEYMDTATSFAASLIQGLGGDTAKAVELTNLAITDMSDNANKMGTDISSIQDAYQGFAKQNYTMLDNLKLGYGGTQSEMIRLINDSGVLGEKIDSLDNVTFDQMISAIHKIQDNLGITGTTALEAGTTISGSWGSVQALFENILTKVGAELAPTVMGFLQQLSTWLETVDWDQFATTVGDALGGVLEWIQQIDFTTFFNDGMEGAKAFLEKLAEFIQDIPEIKAKFEEWLPLITGVATAFGVLQAAMTIQALIQGVANAVLILNAAMAANPIVVIISLIAGLVAGITLLWNTNEGFREAVITAWEAVKTTVGTVIEAIVAFFQGVIETIAPIWESIKAAISEKIEAIKTVFNSMKDTVTAVWDTISNAVQVAVMFIGEIISAAFQIIAIPFQFIWQNCGEYITAAWEGIKTVVSTALDVISNVISTVWNAISAFLGPILEGIKSVIETVWNAIKSVVETVVNGIKSVIETVWNAISGTISTVLNGIKAAFNVWNEIKETVSNVINGVKSTISNGLSGAKSVVSDVLGGIRDKFSNIFDRVKEIVGRAIDTVKGYFDFSWSLPDIKLPHFSISGSFSLKPPSVPSFSIDWYKKAMDDGMVMNQPTIFGYNAKTNQFMAGGEAGSETVVGTSSLMTMISDAVEEKNSTMIERFDKVLSILESYMPVIPEIANMQLVTDTGVLVGEIAPAMDQELGKIYRRQGR